MLTRGKAQKELLLKMSNEKVKPSNKMSTRLSPSWTNSPADRGQLDSPSTPASGTPPLGARKKLGVKFSDVNLSGSPALNDETRCKSLNDDDLYKSSNDDEALYKSSSLGAAGGKGVSQQLRDSDFNYPSYRRKASSQSLSLRSPAARARAAKPIAMPDSYNGKGKISLESWLMHFDVVSGINGWNPEEEAKYIAMSLRDEALTVLTESLGGCTELSSAEIRRILKENFDRPESISTYRQKFQARRRKPGETLTALRHELVKLAREAYPEASEGMIDDLAKDQFITALESQHLRMQVRRGSPMSLEEAFRIATEEEKLWKEEESQFSLRRNTSSVFTERFEQDQSDRIEKMEQQIDLLTQLVKDLATSRNSGSGSGQRNQGGNRRQFQKPRGCCFQCGERGHYISSCPTLNPPFKSSEEQEN